MSIICILGKRLSGKSTLASYLASRFNLQQFAFATPLKEGCRAIFGFNDEQLYGDLKETIDPFWNIAPRAAFQYLGTDIFRHHINHLLPNIDNMFWVRQLEHRLLQAQHSQSKCIVDDARFQSEVDMIHKLGGIVIKIIRPSFDTSVNASHESETSIDLITDYDFILHNDSSLDVLYNRASQLLIEQNLL